MELTYENMEDFIKKYLENYNTLINNIDTIDQLEQFYTPDFTSTLYIHTPEQEYPSVRKGARTFLDFMRQGHENVWEEMIPTNIIVDEKKKMVSAFLKIKMQNQKIGLDFECDGATFYTLVLDENGSIRIKNLDFFISDPEKANEFFSQNVNLISSAS